MMTKVLFENKSEKGREKMPYDAFDLLGKLLAKTAIGGAKVAGKGLMWGAHKIQKAYNDSKAGEQDLVQEGNRPDNVLRRSSPTGFIFGLDLFDRQYLLKPENHDGHVLVLGGSGSGKSSCLAIPTLMAWQSRVFAIDIKGELEEKCRNSPHRRNIKTFNPLDPSAAGFNPYFILDTSSNLSQDAREIALILIPKPENIKDPFWVDGAQNLLTAAIIHYFNEDFTFIETIEKLFTTPLDQIVQEIVSSDVMQARFYINQFVGMKTETSNGIYNEFSNRMMIYVTDSDVRNSLSQPLENCISPIDLTNGCDVFLKIPLHKIEQWKGLITLITNFFLKDFEKRSEQETTPILFLLDEFGRLGKMDIIGALRTLRSKKVTIAILTQSLADFDAIYGVSERKIIVDNCSFKVILNATDRDTQHYFSDLVGTFDRTKETKSESYEPVIPVPHGSSVSTTTEEKRIIKPEEFATLDKIVLLTPYGFMRAEKTPYYATREFQA